MTDKTPMKIDLHVHTHPKSPCSNIRPQDLVEEAQRIGLDGFCLTEHQILWDQEEVTRLFAHSGIKVFRGVEITTAQGDVLVYGLERSIEGVVTVQELAETVKEAGGFAVAAHPFRGFKVFGVGQLGMTLDQAVKKKILQYVDAIEVGNGRVTETENALAAAVAEKTGLQKTAGSDAHELTALGSWVTDFEEEFDDEQGLVAALKSGRYTVFSLR